MQYIEFFRQLEQRLRPRSYLEIGVRWGDSLAVSTVPSIGIDPDPQLRVDLPPTTVVHSMTSDEFFVQPERLRHLPDETIDLAFIDGMHLYEYALRDFINVEAHARPSSVVVLDDMLPRSSEEASRERDTTEWTGDVWKVIPTLQKLRPDLVLIQVATQPTGLLIAMALDAGNKALCQEGGGIHTPFMAADEVPQKIIDRSDAVDPADLLAAPFWDLLQEQRRSLSGAAVREAVAAWSPAPLTADEAQASKASPYFGQRQETRVRQAYQRGKSRLARAVGRS